MFSGVTSSARSPSQTKMMTLRAAGPPGCGAAGPPPSPGTTHDKAMKKMNLLIFMVVLVSEFEGGPRGARHRLDDLEPLRTASRVDADDVAKSASLGWRGWPPGGRSRWRPAALAQGWAKPEGHLLHFLLPYHPETSSRVRYEELSEKNQQLLVVPHILREMRGLTAR